MKIMFDTKFYQKILGSMLVVIIMIPFLVVSPSETKAVGAVKVIVGNHEYGAATNMVIEVTLAVDMVNGAYIDLYFTNVLGEDDLRIEDVNVIAWHDDGTGFKMTDITTSLYNPTLVNNAIQFNGLGISLDAGDIIYYYLGMPDDLSLGYVTGETGFEPISSTHVFTNESSGTGAGVRIDSSIAGNDEMRGAYALASNNDISMSGSIVPYLTMKLASDPTNVIADKEEWVYDSATMTIDTNADEGFTLSYRSTDLERVDNPGVIISPAVDHGNAGGDGEWGLRLIRSGGATGAVATVNSHYNNKFSVYTDGSLHEMITLDAGVTHSYYYVYTMLSSSFEDPAGEYKATITFNVYGNF